MIENIENLPDEEIRIAAIAFAKHNKEKIAKELTDPAIYAPSKFLVSVFMAGSPGAGKTEYSKRLIEILEQNKERRVIRIDADEIRPRMPGYTGYNSHLFQGAVSLIVEKIHDLALHRGQNFIFDSTFFKYDKAADNIRRSLGKTRIVFIFYLYQDPKVAWKFTEIREKKEGRNIPKPAFVEQFLGARETVSLIRKEFGEEVMIILVKRDFEKDTIDALFEIRPGVTIDDYLKISYNKEELESIL